VITLGDDQAIIEDETDVVVHNSEGHSRYDLVSLRVHSANARVVDLSTGKEVEVRNMITKF
jgi:hypothetical protein